jgi:hypothetical protein
MTRHLKFADGKDVTYEDKLFDSNLKCPNKGDFQLFFQLKELI